MPLYEYRCQDCGHRYDQRRPYDKADDPAPCPACDSMQSRRMLATFACTGGERTLSSSGGGCAGCSASSCAGCRR